MGRGKEGGGGVLGSVPVGGWDDHSLSLDLLGHARRHRPLSTLTRRQRTGKLQKQAALSRPMVLQ